MNAGACPAAPVCGNVNTNANNTAANQAGAADKGQSSDFSTVMDGAKAAPAAADSGAASAANTTKPAAAKDTAKVVAKEKQQTSTGKDHSKDPSAANVVAVAGTGDGNPLPSWLALLPLPPFLVAKPVAVSANPADPTKLPDAAAIAAGLTDAVDAVLGGAKGGRPPAGNATVAAVAGNPIGQTTASSSEPVALPLTTSTESAPLLMLAKVGEGPHAGTGETSSQASQFLNTLTTMLSSSDASGTAAAPRAELLASHTAAQAPANGNTVANNAGNAAPAGASIPVPVQNPQWSDAFAARVVWQAGQDLQQAHLHLNPPELGPVEVKLAISNDKVNAQFVTHHIQTQQAIQDAIPRLREMMSQSGMNLMNANVFQQGHGHNGQPMSHPSGFLGATASAEESELGASLPASVPVRVGLVDAYA